MRAPDTWIHGHVALVPLLAACLCALSLLPSGRAPLPGTGADALHGQETFREARGGLFISAGYGVGRLIVDTDGRTDELTDRTSEVAVLRVGGSVRNRLLFGVETDYFSERVQEVELTQSHFTAFLTYYPLPEEGLGLKVRVGRGVFDVDNTVAAGAGTDDVAGWGVGGEVLWAIHLGGGFAIEPFAGLTRVQYRTGGTTLLQAGIGLARY